MADATYDASATAAAPERGGRSILSLVALFVFAFTVAIGWQIKSHHDNSARMIVAAQVSAAALIAERVNANLAIAAGSATGIAELSRASGDIASSAAAVANATARTRPAVAAAVVNRDGVIEAITDPSQAALVQAAVRGAGEAGVWAGAPDVGGLTTAPTLVRRVGDRAVVAILDPHQLLPELDTNARVLIAAPSGTILYASPALQVAGQRAQQQILAATRQSDDSGALIRDGAGDTWAAAESNVQIGDFRVLAATPAPSTLALWLEADALAFLHRRGGAARGDGGAL